MSVDRIDPIDINYWGGANHFSNLQLVCVACNVTDVERNKTYNHADDAAFGGSITRHWFRHYFDISTPPPITSTFEARSKMKSKDWRRLDSTCYQGGAATAGPFSTIEDWQRGVKILNDNEIDRLVGIAQGVTEAQEVCEQLHYKLRAELLAIDGFREWAEHQDNMQWILISRKDADSGRGHWWMPRGVN